MPQLSEIGALPRIGESVGDYTVLDDIAHGGMAAVYIARRKGGLDKLFAIKFLLPTLATDQRFVEMFIDEARIGARIEHPNVVQVFEVGEREGLPFLVMELLRGHSLAAVFRRALQAQDAPSVEELCHILADAARGLDATHGATDLSGERLDVIHRDVSPQNLHVGYGGQVTVMDFGVASAKGRLTKTESGEVKGKLSYMAPEQFHRRRSLDRRVDVWSLGVVAWELFSGRRLFRAEDGADTMWNVLHADIPSLAPYGVPDDVAECVIRCLERDPERRPSSARELVATFGAAAAGGREALANRVCDLFASEREGSGARLRAASASPTVEVAAVRIAPTEAKSRWRTPILAFSAVVLFAALAGGIWLSGGLPDTAPADSAPSATAPAPSAERSLTMAVHESIQLVLIDGVVAERRPIVMPLERGTSRTVTLIGQDGRRVQRDVTRDDDGHMLRMPSDASPEPPEAIAAEPSAHLEQVSPRTRPSRRARPRVEPDRAPVEVDGTDGLMPIPVGTP